MGTPIDALTAREIAREEVDNHEAVCAERYRRLDAGLTMLQAGQDRIHGWMLKGGIGVFSAMFGLICWLVVKLLKIG